MCIALAFVLTSSWIGPSSPAGGIGAGSPPSLAIRRPSGPNLVARCVWAERGWEAISLGLELDQPEARRIALRDLEEHQRLHGWVGGLGDGLSWMISVPAICPPAALVELSERELLAPTLELYPLYWQLARVFAETGHVSPALHFLDAIRDGELEAPDAPSDPREGVALGRARVLQQAGLWERALSALEHSPEPNAAQDLVRMRSLLELGRTTELEQLVVRALRNGQNCLPLELLIEAWQKEHAASGFTHLLVAIETRLGKPVSERTSERLETLWSTAVEHRRILASHSRYADSALAGLLDRGDHRRDVLDRLEAGGTDVVDDLLERLTLLLGSSRVEDARTLHELVLVLAETGDPRVMPALETIGGEGPLSPLERWRKAKALRSDLAEERPR